MAVVEVLSTLNTFGAVACWRCSPPGIGWAYALHAKRPVRFAGTCDRPESDALRAGIGPQHGECGCNTAKALDSGPLRITAAKGRAGWPIGRYTPHDEGGLFYASGTSWSDQLALVDVARERKASQQSAPRHNSNARPACVR